MSKKINLAFASALGSFLISIGFAFALNIGESLGKSTYQLGLILGIFIGLPILVAAFTDAKKESSGQEGLVPKEIFKYIIPIIMGIAILAIFLAPNADVIGELVGGIFSGLFMFLLPAVLIRFLMGGVKGLETGFEKRSERWIKGESADQELKDFKKFFELNKKYREVYGPLYGYSMPSQPSQVPQTPVEHAQTTNTAARVAQAYAQQGGGNQ